MALTKISTTIVLASALIANVAGHGYVTQPLAEFVGDVMKTKYVGIIEANSMFPGVKFDDSPDANVAQFTKNFANCPYKTLKEFMASQGGECGATNPNASPKPIPADGVLIWQNPDTGDGFVPSHTGPCEAWINDKRVFHDENCAGHYPGKPKAEIKIDFSSCTSNCVLRFYWLALHQPSWQVYKNCIPLVGNGGSPASPESAPVPTPAADTPTVAPVPTPAADTPTVAPATQAPQPTTVAPYPDGQPPATTAPSSGKKCSPKKRV